MEWFTLIMGVFIGFILGRYSDQLRDFIQAIKKKEVKR